MLNITEIQLDTLIQVLSTIAITCPIEDMRHHSYQLLSHITKTYERSEYNERSELNI
jgi:hypothetical protein